MSRQVGDRVWYQPQDGCRFAGVVLGSGTWFDKYNVGLPLLYWLFVRRPEDRMVLHNVNGCDLFDRATQSYIDSKEEWI